MSQNNIKCNSSKFKRVEYFEGMLLTEQDFQDEQVYMREKFKLHNRLFGKGVVWGLALKLKEVVLELGNKPKKVVVGAGFALDCAGNEILVCKDHLIPLDEKISDLYSRGILTAASEEGPKLFIGIRYCECKSEPAEKFASTCSEDKLNPQYSRTLEGFSILILTKDEYEEFICSDESHCMDDACPPECPGIPQCSEKDLILFLGTIEGYSINRNDLNHAGAEIKQFDNRIGTSLYKRTLVSVYSNWEEQKIAMLSHLYKENDAWIDVSFLLGQSAINIETKLVDMGLNWIATYAPPELPGDLINKLKCALPWAQKMHKDEDGNWDRNSGSPIEIVTDSSGNCIIFVIVSHPTG